MRTGVIESQGVSPNQPSRAPSASARERLDLRAAAVLFNGERSATVGTLSLTAPQVDDVVVDVLWSGISTGTERLMWTG